MAKIKSCDTRTTRHTYIYSSRFISAAVAVMSVHSQVEPFSFRDTEVQPTISYLLPHTECVFVFVHLKDMYVAIQKREGTVAILLQYMHIYICIHINDGRSYVRTYSCTLVLVHALSLPVAALKNL